MENTPKREIVFADGASFDRPTPNQPKWVKGKLSFNVERFKTFLDTHRNIRGYVNVDLKEGQSGKLYLSLNDWVKPEALKRGLEEDKTYRSNLEDVIEYPADDINPEDVPF